MFYLSILFDLTRPWIALFAAFSAVTGMILAAGRLSPAMGVLSLGVFILACGASALNQFQEIDFDRLMARTRARPLPSGKLSPRWGITCSLILILSGLLLLSFVSWRASLLGAAALVWYNGFYTPLKKRTPFAVIPGALIGAIPPLLGWVVGGGDWRSPRILALAFFFFLWQVPHFWLLLIDEGEDYEKAGFPSLTSLFSREQLSRITFIWILSTAVASTILPIFGLTDSSWSPFLLLTAAVWLSIYGVRMVRNTAGPSAPLSSFRRTNLFVLFVMTLLSLDQLI